MGKIAENCKISQKFGVSKQILYKIGVQLAIMWKSTLSIWKTF